MTTLTDIQNRNAMGVDTINCKRGYSCTVPVTAAASATDVATLTGGAARLVLPKRVIITGIQTTGGQVEMFLIKRSAADTGGTTAAGTVVPHDAAFPPSLATVLAYSANPGALGAAVGNLRRDRVMIPAAASVAIGGIEWVFGDRSGEVALRGIAQQLAVNLNGVTVAGGVLNVTFEWDEYPA